MKIFIITLSILVASVFSTTSCPTPTKKSMLVAIYFWKDDSTCSGSTLFVNYFPIDYLDTDCYCWNGSEGTTPNAGTKWTCDSVKKTFTYTQYAGTYSCTGGTGANPNGVIKSPGETCITDFPPILTTKLGDFTCCHDPTNEKCLDGGSMYGIPRIEVTSTTTSTAISQLIKLSFTSLLILIFTLLLS